MGWLLKRFLITINDLLWGYEIVKRLPMQSLLTAAELKMKGKKLNEMVMLLQKLAHFQIFALL